MVEHKIEYEVSQKIIFLQFIMSMIVCMGHIGFGGAIEPINVMDGKIHPSYQWLISEMTTISVLLYMELSAFLLYYNCNEKNFVAKFYRRIFTLALPYLVWNVIYGVFYWLVEKREIFNLEAIYRGLLIEPWDGSLWFVLTLLSFLPLLFILGPAKKWWQTLLIIIMITVFLKYGSWENIPILRWFCTQWNTYGKFYFVGVLIARICPQLICERKYNGKQMVIAGMLLLVLELANRGGCAFIPGWLSGILTYLGVIALWMIVPATLAEKSLSNKWIAWISKKTFIIYAGHVLIGKILMRVIFVPYIYSRRAYAGYEATIIMMLTQLSVFVCLFFLLYIMEKVVPKKVLSILAGGRGV